VATSGDYDQALAKLNLPDRQLPISSSCATMRGRILNCFRAWWCRVARPGDAGQCSEPELESGPAQIDRYDRQRNISFEIELAGQPLGKVQKAVTELPSIKNMPEAWPMAAIGEAEAMQELFASFGLAMFTGVIVHLHRAGVAVQGFHAARHHYVGADPVDTRRFPGAVPDAHLDLDAFDDRHHHADGIATKNSILLVEYPSCRRRERGMTVPRRCWMRAKTRASDRDDHHGDGCRHAAVALDLGVGDGSFRSPMAIVVIGGLITSTFLSLLVIPVVYTYVDDFIEWMKARFNKFRSASRVPAACLMKM